MAQFDELKKLESTFQKEAERARELCGQKYVEQNTDKILPFKKELSELIHEWRICNDQYKKPRKSNMSMPAKIFLSVLAI